MEPNTSKKKGFWELLNDPGLAPSSYYTSRNFLLFLNLRKMNVI